MKAEPTDTVSSRATMILTLNSTPESNRANRRLAESGKRAVKAIPLEYRAYLGRRLKQAIAKAA
jgi:hypothetical protein